MKYPFAVASCLGAFLPCMGGYLRRSAMHGCGSSIGRMNSSTSSVTICTWREPRFGKCAQDTNEAMTHYRSRIRSICPKPPRLWSRDAQCGRVFGRGSGI